MPRSWWYRHCGGTGRARYRSRHTLAGDWLGCCRDQLEPAAIDTLRGKPPGDQITECRFTVWQAVQHQPRCRHIMQDARPRGDDRVVQPLRSSEIPEGDEAIGKCWKRSNGRHRIRRCICQRDAWQPYNALAEQPIRAGRSQHRIREEGIHRGKARGVAVAQQILDLHRRRPACEDQQTAAGSMAGESTSTSMPSRRIKSATAASSRSTMSRQCSTSARNRSVTASGAATAA